MIKENISNLSKIEIIRFIIAVIFITTIIIVIRINESKKEVKEERGMIYGSISVSFNSNNISSII